MEESAIESKHPAQDIQVLAALKEVKTRAVASQKAQLQTAPGDMRLRVMPLSGALLSLHADFSPGLLHR
jgi:hypothetical protein